MIKKYKLFQKFSWLLVGICCVLFLALLLLKCWPQLSKYIDEELITVPDEATNSNISNQNKPEIVDFYACSDNCPLEESTYWVKIYKGVVDSQECQRLNGDFRIMYGWQETPFCVVK